MIKNSHEYNLTSSALSKFNKRKALLEQEVLNKDTELEIKGIIAISNDLTKQINQYEHIKSGLITFQLLENLRDLPTVLIGKRLQLNINQKDMAEKLTLDTLEYIMLENNDFYGIDTSLFKRILLILNLENPNQILTKDYDTLIPKIEVNLKELSKKSSFISVSSKPILEHLKKKSSLTAYYIENLIEQFKELFCVSIQEEINMSKINTSLAVAFKHNINVNENNLNFSTAYAAYAAKVITKQMNTSLKCKADPISIRQEIIKKSKQVTLESCLDFIWKLNIAVIPLNMHGSFHGACIDFDKTKAIILSQQHKTISRWKFDLLHELYHALVMDYSLYIERTDIMDQDDQEEKQASEFASYVIFGQEMESILGLIIDKSGGHMELIKNSTALVAKEFGINLDDLSNYVAFRVSKGTLSFWGSAMNMQSDLRNPADLCINHLYEQIHISNLSTFELNVLQTIFNQEVIHLG